MLCIRASIDTLYWVKSHVIRIQNAIKLIWGGGGGGGGNNDRVFLRCLHGKVDTTISCVCVHVLLAPPSALGAWSMALVLWLPYYCR